MNGEGAENVSDALREYLAPAAVDPILQEAVRFSRPERTKQGTDVCAVEFDTLRGKAESERQMRGASPKQFASVLRVQNASLYRPEK